MHYAPKYAGLLAVAILVTGCAGMSTGHKSVHSDIAAVSKQQGELITKGDAAGVAALYSSDAQMLPPNEELVTGKAGILKYWQNSIAAGPATVTLTSMEAEGCGDTAWEVGKYTATGTDGKILDKGKYITIWKRENGTWKLHRDTFNSDMPVAKP
jgi:ketosteroid isomerase-like protein